MKAMRGRGANLYKGPELGVHGALAGWNKKWAAKRKLVLKGPKCCSITLGLCPAGHKEPWVGRGAVEQSCGRMCVPERKQLVSI